MKFTLSNPNTLIKVIATLATVIGAIQLPREIHDYLTLPTTVEMDEQYGGLVDLLKYKENTYCLLLLWSTVLLTGVSYWISRPLNWILTQALLLALIASIVAFILILIIHGIDHAWFPLMIMLLIVALTSWIKFRLYNRSFRNEIKIGRWSKVSSIAFGIALSAVYLYLEVS